MALGANLRTPMFYDREGPYNRYVFDNQGRIAGLNDEWRGVLKYDYTLAYYVSHSFLGGAGWANFYTGYTWRTGAPADQIPAVLEGGYPLPWFGIAVKGQVLWVWIRITTLRGSPTTDSAATPLSASTARAWAGSAAD